MKSPDTFYSDVDENFELWVLLGSFASNVWNFNFDTFAKDFKRLCWIKITYLWSNNYNVIFFSLSSTVSENFSAEIILRGEINQPRGIQFPQTKGRSFQENWFDLYNLLHYDEKKDGRRLYIYKRTNLEHSRNTARVTVIKQL